jgi:hypothetical protein
MERVGLSYLHGLVIYDFSLFHVNQENFLSAVEARGYLGSKNRDGYDHCGLFPPEF